MGKSAGSCGCKFCIYVEGDCDEILNGSTKLRIDSKKVDSFGGRGPCMQCEIKLAVIARSER